MAKRNPDCPCTNTSCPRHGDCAACRDYHHSLGGQTSCEKLKGKNG